MNLIAWFIKEHNIFINVEPIFRDGKQKFEYNIIQANVDPEDKIYADEDNISSDYEICLINAFTHASTLIQ